MSLGTLLQVPKTVTIEGVDVEFPRVTIYDLSQIDEGRKAYLKEIARRNAESQGLTKPDIFNIFIDIETRDFTIGEILSYATTPRGSVSVLERSLIKGGMKLDDAKTLISKMNPIDVLQLAQDLVIQPKKEDVEVEKKVSTPTPVVSEPSTSTATKTTSKTSKKEDQTGFGE